MDLLKPDENTSEMRDQLRQRFEGVDTKRVSSWSLADDDDENMAPRMRAEFIPPEIEQTSPRMSSGPDEYEGGSNDILEDDDDDSGDLQGGEWTPSHLSREQVNSSISKLSNLSPSTRRSTNQGNETAPKKDPPTRYYRVDPTTVGQADRKAQRKTDNTSTQNLGQMFAGPIPPPRTNTRPPPVDPEELWGPRPEKSTATPLQETVFTPLPTSEAYHTRLKEASEMQDILKYLSVHLPKTDVEGFKVAMDRFSSMSLVELKAAKEGIDWYSSLSSRSTIENGTNDLRAAVDDLYAVSREIRATSTDVESFIDSVHASLNARLKEDAMIQSCVVKMRDLLEKYDLRVSSDPQRSVSITELSSSGQSVKSHIGNSFSASAGMSQADADAVYDHLQKIGVPPSWAKSVQYILQSHVANAIGSLLLSIPDAEEAMDVINDAVSDVKRGISRAARP